MESAGASRGATVTGQPVQNNQFAVGRGPSDSGGFARFSARRCAPRGGLKISAFLVRHRCESAKVRTCAALMVQSNNMPRFRRDGSPPTSTRKIAAQRRVEAVMGSVTAPYEALLT